MLNPSLLLQVAIGTPLLAALLLFFHRFLGRTLAQCLAFIGFLCPLVIGLSLLRLFPYNVDPSHGYAFTSALSTGLDALGIQLSLGLNGISLPLFLLAGIVGLAAGLYAMHSQAPNVECYYACLLIMLSGLLGAFASINILFFYFFHELALIPTFVMIGLWGGQSRRSAAIEMTVYLSLGALVSLIGLIALYVKSDCHQFSFIDLKSYLAIMPLSQHSQRVIFALLLFGLGTLVSLFPFHSWAPRGYACAPTAAAMLHAGVLKKFGLYGLIQIALPLLPQGIAHWQSWLVALALCNVLFIGFVTLAQRDLKLMLGYSSVMHMGYCFLGLACFCAPSSAFLGIGGAVLLMFGHGLSVALLFLLSAYIYRRTQSYDLQAIGGLCTPAPVLSAFFIAATFASIGLPGFANFWGEFSIFMALWAYHPLVAAASAVGIVLSAIYGLRAVARIFFGQPTEAFHRHVESSTDLTATERLPALLLFIGLLWIGFWPSTFTQPLDTYLQNHYFRPVLVAS